MKSIVQILSVVLFSAIISACNLTIEQRSINGAEKLSGTWNISQTTYSKDTGDSTNTQNLGKLVFTLSDDKTVKNVGTGQFIPVQGQPIDFRFNVSVSSESRKFYTLSITGGLVQPSSNSWQDVFQVIAIDDNNLALRCSACAKTTTTNSNTYLLKASR